MVSRYPLKNTHENTLGGKEITWPTHSLWTPAYFKWRSQEKKGKERENPKLHPELIKYYIADEQTISGVIVIVVGNEHGDTSSNPGRDWLHFT